MGVFRALSIYRRLASPVLVKQHHNILGVIRLHGAYNHNIEIYNSTSGFSFKCACDGAIGLLPCTNTSRDCDE